MSHEQFWKLVEQTKQQAGGSTEQQFELITAALEQMNAEGILSFENILRDQLRRGYTFDMLAAAFIILSYVSDDVFADFRAWLISQGRERFEKALQFPASIAEFLTRDEVDNITGEGLLLAACVAYESRTGGDDFFAKAEVVADPELHLDWPETREQFRERYPVLYDSFWNQERIEEIHKKD